LHEHGALAEKLRAYARADGFEQGRSIFAVEEAWLHLRLGPVLARAGFDVLNWTVLDAFHPADVINPRNLDSDIENFDKLGEPMATLEITPFEGTTLSGHFMPWFRRPHFPPPASRLGFAPAGVYLGPRWILVDHDGRLTDDPFIPQAAVRLRQRIGTADVSVHALQHIDRGQPLAVADALARFPLAAFLKEPGPLLVWSSVGQVGGTCQQALGRLVLKIEGAYRRFVPMAELPESLEEEPRRDHGVIALGLWYTLPHAGGAHSTFLLEGQVVVGPEALVRAALGPFQRDAFGGYRFAWNDEESREFRVGGVVDLEGRREWLLSAEYRQRLGETWTVRLGVRIFHAPSGETGHGLEPLRDGDHARIILTRHF
jgi:hypothetical protein